jgi:iron complex transport system ATP-binding protein
VNLLEANNLHFAYGQRPVLSGVSLRLAAGEIVALLGPNGSGKSTLLRVLLGQLNATGQVLWDGQPVRAISRRQLARRVAYLPQSPVVETEQAVVDVLRNGRAPYWGAFGLESQQDAQVVHEVSAQLGLDDLLRRPIGELSGGQRQVVFVARCLVQKPAAVLLDEPTTYLDLRHQVELSQLLSRLARQRNMGILMASHDINLAASVADRLILLDQGIIAAEGPPAQVLQPEVLSRVYGVAIRRIDSPGDSFPIIVPDLARCAAAE